MFTFVSQMSSLAQITTCSVITLCFAPQELFGSDGVEMAVHFLKKGSDKFYSGLGHNKLVLSTVDCVWSVQLNLSTLSYTNLHYLI